MRSLIIDALGIALVGLVLYFCGLARPAAPLVAPQPVPAPCPVCPQPRPDEKKPRPWLPWRPHGDSDPFAVEGAAGAITVGGPVAPDGKTELATDIDRSVCKPNIASKGLGCCVFRSLDYIGHWQNVPALQGFPEWMVSKGIEGGGYPQKVAQLIPRIAADRGQPPVQFINYEGPDTDLLEQALRQGRMVGVTYNGRDPHYRGTIAHMVDLVYLDKTQGAICDNNFPKETVWMSRDEFLSRWKGGSKNGWAVIITSGNAPPPPPRN